MPQGASSTENALGWCMERLRHLAEIVGDLASIQSEALYEQGAWTALKEIFLATYNAWIYSRIVPKYFREWYYIDPLCGPGIVRIKDTGDLIAGSPIIAAMTSKEPFTKMFLADQEPTFRTAVTHRLNRLQQMGYDIRFDEPAKDCNILLQSVGNQLPKRHSNFLAFIDLQGMEVNWQSFSGILSKLGDVIVTFNTGQIQRPWGMAKKGDEANAIRFDHFYGGDYWMEAQKADDLPVLYLRKLEETGRFCTERIRIRREDPPILQDLLFAARETSGGSPWFDAVRNHIKPRVEANTDESVRRALEIVTGRQPTLDWFFNILKDSSKQATLHKFENP